ncbi:hypothetical protein SNE40_007435 [Patella caerulea]|uniref:Chloride channel protein n=1 Tax=Patella caerulea TaxID=87958 RepID=A0AAN8JYH8_PATCE
MASENEVVTPETIVIGENGSSGNNLRKRKTLGIYGSNVDPPKDDDVFYVTDDHTYGAFAQGRDYEPIYITHKYTAKEKETLATFESLDYLPSNSEVYKQWLKRKRVSRLQMDRWFMMGLIGFCVGLVGFLLHQLIEIISDVKWETTSDLLADNKQGLAWLFAVGFSVVFIVCSAAIVVFWRPSAAGSGIPEVTGFLNGTNVRHIFSLQTMFVKFLSCVMAIGCGMPVGPEGPMIHLGGLVGAGLSQTKSETLRIKIPMFERFRNSEDRRNFISAGAAAGVASAFGAPVGGLLFSMEEVSSYWTTTLSWQIFFCCMISAFTTDLFNSAFRGFTYSGDFGQFKTERYILFNINKGVDVNILMFIPTVIIGILGGTLGALFTIINLKITRGRKKLLARIKRNWIQKSVRLFEPAVIMVIVSTVSLFLPAAFPCSSYRCIEGDDRKVVENCVNSTTSSFQVESDVMQYTCPKGVDWNNNGTSYHTNRTYNELASLLYGTTETAVRHLFSRTTHLQFGYATLFTALPYFFFMVCWSSGTSVSSGILVPMLLIGSLYGRIIGLVMVSAFGVQTDKDSYWVWMDPGAFALIGAASFFGGVSRLTLAVTVIMMELTNDVQVLLPVMVAVMVGKWSGDFFTHPIFHAHLELKCIPFLDPEPRLVAEGKSVQFELYQTQDVMTSPVRTINICEPISVLSDLLLHSSNGGFPVVKNNSHGEPVFYGMITRLELTVLLMHEKIFIETEEEIDDREADVTLVGYEKLMVDKLVNPQEVSHLLNQYIDEDRYKNLKINLKPYINTSAFSIPKSFSLQRAYILFRTMGLRHLTVVDDENHVVGIITRKDLMGFNLNEKLSGLLFEELEKNSRVAEMTSPAAAAI